MSDVLHANIFFFITSVVVVALGLLWVVILWYVIAILREARIIARRIREATEDLERDIAEFRASMRAGGAHVRSLGGTLFEFAVRMLARGPRRSQTHPPEEGAESDDLVE